MSLQHPAVRLILGALIVGQLACNGCSDAPVSPWHCSNGQLDGDESSLDCGGSCGACSVIQPSGCTANAECPGGLCIQGICTPASCTDGVSNASETGVDCGGPDCAACGPHQACLEPRDCQSGACLDGVCQPPTCTDGVRNGTEVDVDCGGNCAACGSGETCQSGSDCQSGVCTGGTCQAPACTDGVQNGGETGVDCGGASCGACGDGETCQDETDCTSGHCSGGVCVPASCTDGVENGGETDVDCGGSACAACDTGEVCEEGDDCQSGVCTEETCTAPTCSDGVENGEETDVDCGGSTCAACGTGSTCEEGQDCQEGVCVGGTCVGPACTDGIQNGQETGVDCGGPACGACGTGGGCTGNGDCLGGVCTGQVCQAPTCTDGVTNGDETDVDCGGGTCAVCETGSSCEEGTDCQEGVCVQGTCVSPECTDGVQNGQETDVDCGGPVCNGCGTGGGCSGSGDCTGGVCDGQVCQAPTCTDGVKNGEETDVDCGGGTCAVCGDGSTCQQGPDCQSGVCDGQVCQAATCTDGVKNGAETGQDCGGPDCCACGNGETCTGTGDCTSGVCVEGVCQGCLGDSQCQGGYVCQDQVCVPDLERPTMEGAFLPRTTVLRVAFSEAMDPASSGVGATRLGAWCIERSDDTPDACSPNPDFTILAVDQVAPAHFDLTLSSQPLALGYTVKVTGVADLAGNPIGTPDYADFEGQSQFRVISARSAGTHQVLLSFSRAVVAVPDAAGSAVCTSAQECGGRYRLVGASSLGGVQSAEIQPIPRENEVLLTHAAAQVGGNYTLIAANGVAGDGFNDAGAIRSASNEALGLTPLDRATFGGLGLPIVHFGDGPLSSDPFGDGSEFSFVFRYGEKVYLGPNRTGQRSVRMNADGSQVEDMTWRLGKDVNKGIGTHSLNSATAPFPGVGHAGCQNNSHACGPDNEDGRGLFTSGQLDGREWLVLGGGQSGGGLDYIYLARDQDTTLQLKYVDLSNTLGGTTKSFSAMGVYGGRAYLGFPDTSGSRKPILVTLLRPPADSAPGLDTRGNGQTGTACDPGRHDACNLLASHMPGIGVSGTPANETPVVMVDFVAEHNGLLHLGNNGGLMRATVPQPLDYVNAPQHWTSIVPSHAAYRAFTSITTLKLTDLEPRDRAFTSMAVFKGRVYLGRNTTEGPQLWRCDSETVTGPAPASVESCDSGDWTLVAGNAVGDSRLSQFDDADNERMTMLIASGDHLYVGFDNAVDGIRIYRTAAAQATSLADFEGEGCVPGASSCTGLGGDGFGDPAANARINDAVALTFDGQSYLYVAVGNGTAPVRIYRHRD